MAFPKVKDVVSPDVLLVCFLSYFCKLTMKFFQIFVRVRFMVEEVVTLYISLSSDLDLDTVS